MRILNPTSAAAGRRGHAMLLAVTLLTSLMILSYAFFRPTTSAQKDVNAKLDDRRAFALAEAGLGEAMDAIRQGQSGGIGSPAQPAWLGGGILWVTSTDLGNDRIQLVSTAAIGSGRQTLTAVVRDQTDPDPLFVATLNSKELLTLNADVMIDSFDSDLGPYAKQAVNTKGIHTYAGEDGDVRSNEDVVLNARAAVFGDAIPGPGHTVTFATDAFVTGTTTPSTETFSFPGITVPSYGNMGSLSLSPGKTATMPAGNYELTSLSIGKSAALTVVGPANVVVDDFTGGKDGRLYVDATNGPVTVYVRKTYSHISGFEADAVAGSPMALAFMVEGTQDVVFPAATAIRGAYYLPNANIVFSNDNEAWGSFAANRIDMSNTMKFHYDVSLAKYWDADTGSDPQDFELLSWAVSEVPDDDLRMDRRDPLVVLGLRRTALSSPYESWVEKLAAQ